MAADTLCLARLGDVCTKIGSGATPRGGGSVYQSTGTIALIRSQNIYNDGFYENGLVFIGHKHAVELQNVEVHSGDVLINITGDSVARCCQVPARILPARVNQHVAILRTDPNRLDPRYLRYVMVSPQAQRQLLSWAGSGGTRNALTKGMLASFEIGVPPLDEQRRIAHILGTLDDKIELNRRMSETLEAMARALFKSWFVDFDPVRAKAEGRDPGLPEHLAGLFPDRFEESELGPIPAGWRAGTLADVADVNPEVWTARNAPEQVEYVDLTNTKWGRIENTQRFAWDEAPSRARRVLRPGDTIVGTVRPGNGSYALISREGLTGSTGFAVLRPKKPEWREFVYLAATAPDNIEWLAHLADGAAYPAVRPGVVIGTPVVGPVEGFELGAFSASAAAVLFRKAAAERQSRSVAAIHELLLPSMMAGAAK
jgi:type I restriction enzyme, S subunit